MSEQQWQKIDDRLHAVETQTSLILSTLKSELGSNGVVGNVPRMLALLRDELREMKMQLLGTLDHPGVVLRLDRLEIAEERRARTASAALVALVGLVAKAGWDLLAG
jgi:hypothetical protein